MGTRGARLKTVVAGVLVAAGVMGAASGCVWHTAADGRVVTSRPAPTAPAPAPERMAATGLLGAWWVEEVPGFLYTFETDGTGCRGTSERSETFTWTVTADGGLDISRSGAPQGHLTEERWTLELAGDALTLTSRQVEGSRFTLARIDLEADAVVGAWAWEQDPAWRYVFASDGAAVRGRGSGPEFRWFVSGDRMLFVNGDQTEVWQFDVVGDSLTLRSLDGESEYRYQRVTR